MALKKNWVNFISESSGFDIIDGLWQMNLLHVLNDIFNALDSCSLKACSFVCLEWQEILSHINYKRSQRVREFVTESKISVIDVNTNEIAIGTSNGMVLVLNRQKFTEIRSFRAHSDSITALAVLTPGRIVTGSIRGVVRLWKGEEMLKSWPCHNDWVQDVKLSVANELLTCSSDGTIAIITNWNSRSSAIIRKARTPGQGEELLCLRPFPKQYQFLVGGLSGLWLVRRRPRQPTTVRSLPMSTCVSCDVDPEGKIVCGLGLRAQHCQVMCAYSFEILALVNCRSIITSVAIAGRSLFVSVANQDLNRYLLPDRHSMAKGLAQIDELHYPNWCQSGIVAQDEYSCFLPFSTVKFEPKSEHQTVEKYGLWHIDFGEVHQPDLSEEPKSDLKQSPSATSEITRLCQCGLNLGDVDQTFHLFLACPLFQVERRSLFKKVSALLRDFSHKCMRDQMQVLLYGSDTLDIEQSAKLQGEVQSFARVVNAGVLG